MGSTASVQMVMVQNDGGRAVQVRVGDPADMINAMVTREIQRQSSNMRSLVLPDDSNASGVGRMVMLLDNLVQFLNSQGVSQASEQNPAPRGVVSDIPCRTLKSNDDKLDVDCYICLQKFEVGDHVRTLPCKHEFHKICVDKWLVEMSRTCPACRADVTSTSEESAAAAPPPVQSISSRNGNQQLFGRATDRFSRSRSETQVALPAATSPQTPSSRSDAATNVEAATHVEPAASPPTEEAGAAENRREDAPFDAERWRRILSGRDEEEETPPPSSTSNLRGALSRSNTWSSSQTVGRDNQLVSARAGTAAGGGLFPWLEGRGAGPSERTGTGGGSFRGRSELERTNPARMLLNAAATGDLRAVSRLVNEGVAVDSEDMNRFSALHYAGGAGQLEAIRVLVQLGADTQHCDKFGRTAAEYARVMGRREAHLLLRSLET